MIVTQTTATSVAGALLLFYFVINVNELIFCCLRLSYISNSISTKTVPIVCSKMSLNSTLRLLKIPPSCFSQIRLLVFDCSPLIIFTFVFCIWILEPYSFPTAFFYLQYLYHINFFIGLPLTLITSDSFSFGRANFYYSVVVELSILSVTPGTVAIDHFQNLCLYVIFIKCFVVLQVSSVREPENSSELVVYSNCLPNFTQFVYPFRFSIDQLLS